MIDFLCIGAQKAGTTWLYSHLSKNSHIVIPRRKEYHFWNTWDGTINRHFSQYYFDYPEHNNTIKYGDMTPAYSILPSKRIKWIHAFQPDVKIIFILRNPIDRAWSAARMALKKSQMLPSEASEQWFLDVINSSASITRGDYAACLKNWLAIFPQNQMLLIDFESLSKHPTSVLKDCCDLINIDHSPYNDKKYINSLTQPIFQGSMIPMPTPVKEQLHKIYKPKIRALSELLDRDFNKWLIQ